MKTYIMFQIAVASCSQCEHSYNTCVLSWQNNASI